MVQMPLVSLHSNNDSGNPSFRSLLPNGRLKSTIMEAMTETPATTVAIIGSFRKYYDEVLEAARYFEKADISVLTPPDSYIVDPRAEFVRFGCDPEDLTDNQIQSETLDRIFAADFVYVVAPDGYIGRTTCYELGRAYERNMTVYYSESPADLPVEVSEESIVSYRDLTEKLRDHRMAIPLAVSAHVLDGQPRCLEKSVA